MLDYSGQGHGQRPAEFADRGRPLAEPFHHQAAARVGECVKHLVQVRQLVKHILEHDSRPGDSQVTTSALTARVAVQAALPRWPRLRGPALMPPPRRAWRGGMSAAAAE